MLHRYPHALLAVVIFAGSVSALAQDGAYPRISGELAVEIQNDHVYHSRPPGASLNDLFTTTEPSLAVEFSEEFSLQAGAVLEPVIDAVDDRAFEDHGLYLEQIFLQWSRRNWRLQAGKFNPAFGIGWDVAPGIYGADFAEDYEITEQWGLAGAVDVANGGRFGAVTVSLAAFMADRSPLSESLFTNRGRTRLAAGGAGNTRTPRSLTLTVDGADVPGMAGLGYHAGVLLRAGGEGDPGDERAVVLGLTQTVALGEAQELELMVEGAYVADSGAGPDDIAYLTTGATWRRGGWNLAAAGALRQTHVRNGADVDDHLFQVSGGYAFVSGVTLDVGWRLGREDGQRTRTLGALAGYSLEF